MAQLAAHLSCKQVVRGSSPLAGSSFGAVNGESVLQPPSSRRQPRDWLAGGAVDRLVWHDRATTVGAGDIGFRDIRSREICSREISSG